MLREGYLEKMLFLSQRKSKRLVSNAIERRNQSIRRRKHRTIPYSNNGKTEVDSEDATTDNEKRIQEVSNQNKSKFNIEPNESESSGVRQRESIIDGPHAKAVDHLKTYNISIN